MDKRLLFVMLAGVAISAVASLMLYKVMQTRMSDGAQAGTVQVCVAARDIDAGRILREEDLRMFAWAGPVPANAILRKSDAVGRGVAAKILKDEPVIQARLSAPGAGAGLAAMIPAGMRAVGVKVNEVVGVAGFVLAGTHVDVISSAAQANGSGSTMTKTILQDIAVLSAGQDYQQDADGKPASVQVVNLLVTPHQAEVLSLAGNQTTIQLVLRGALDREQVETPGASLASILGSGATSNPATIPAAAPPVTARLAKVPVLPTVPAIPQPAVKEPPPAANTVELIYGSKRSTISLEPEEARK